MSAIRDSQPVDFYDFGPNDMVTLILGPHEKKMLVHGKYLCRTSEYFKGALKKEWLEGDTRTITLPECPAIMAHYMAFAYSSELPTTDHPLEDEDDFEYCYQLLANLYVYGERFLNSSLKEAVMTEFFRLMDTEDASGIWWSPTQEEVNIIYRGTPANSPARRLMVDVHIRNGQEDWICDDLEPSFLVDLAKAFYKNKPRPAPGQIIFRRRLKLEGYL